MLELFWGILNLFLFATFIFICLKSIKAIREKLGILASLLFVFGLMSFITKSETNSSEENQFDLHVKTAKNQRIVKEVLVEKRIVTSINLFVYGNDVNGKFEPSKATLNRGGFVSGTKWIPKNCTVEKSAIDGKYKYNVSGVLEWRLLGLTLFSEQKDFIGNVTL